MANIFVSVPILDRPELKMISSLYQAAFSSKEHKVRLYFNENDSLISRVRNVHISVFFNEYPECEYFVSIDSDIEMLNCYPSNNIFDKLTSHNLDFVGGLYSLKKPGQTICSSICEDETFPKFDSGLKEMRWLSSGCWCWKRSAIAKMIAAYPELIYDGDDNAVNKKIYGLYIPFIYETEVNAKDGTKRVFKKYLSEDWSMPLHPDTKILCNNFVFKPIKNIDIGETLIAFDENPINGSKRRQMVKSKVIDKIYKVLPRIKIKTEDGNEVITTIEHEWLIKRSWRATQKGKPGTQPMGNPQKALWQRTDKLHVGDYIYTPVENCNGINIMEEEYIIGYINGMWDGDGHVSYHKKYNSIGIMLKVCDYDIINRIKIFCDKLKIKLNEGVQKRNDVDGKKRKDVYALYVRSELLDKDNRNKFLAIYDGRGIIKEHSDIWCKGYMAGIFDAEGTYAASALAIYQKEFPFVVEKIRKYSTQVGYNFKQFDFGFRLTGIQNIYKFFIEVCPAVNRKKDLKGKISVNYKITFPQKKSKIIEITPMNENGEMICLTTDSHTFIANGFASHNCQRWKAIGGKVFADTSIVLNHIGKTSYPMWNVELVKKPVVAPPPAGFDLSKEVGKKVWTDLSKKQN